MKLVIDNEQPIALIREQFNRSFPFLKLEFFLKTHSPGQTSSLKYKQPWSKKIGELRNGENGGEITLHPDMTVGELEQLFGQQYGLAVQVFRRFGSNWLETAKTDSWTLAALNSQAEKDEHFL